MRRAEPARVNDTRHGFVKVYSYILLQRFKHLFCKKKKVKTYRNNKLLTTAV